MADFHKGLFCIVLGTAWKSTAWKSPFRTAEKTDLGVILDSFNNDHALIRPGTVATINKL
jgi:hypothetical protein